MRAILTYHSIDPSGSPISVSPSAFARHAAFLASGAVQVVGLEELIELPPDADALAVTFDDGFANFATEAHPRLSAHGLPATVYLVTDRVGADNSWGGAPQPGIPELPLMRWETVGRLAEEGVRFDAHSRTHAHLPAVADAQVVDEVEGAREEIRRRTGRDPNTFCYPYGEHDDRIVDAVRRCYAAAVTTDLRWLAEPEDPHLLPRLDAWYLQAPGRLESFGSAGFRRHVQARAFLRGVRGRLRRSLERRPVR